MFTCIIPTLWKSRRIIQLVNDLCNCPSVGEVIIIDNAPNIEQFTTNSVHKYQVEDHTKLKKLEMEKNIYVNPAWNLGVEHAKFDDIALINDDINFNTGVFKLFDDESLIDKGIIGMATENYKLKADEILSIKPHKVIRYGWGCLIFVNRKNYVPIPDDLLIYCGDNWLTSRIKPFNILCGLKIQTEMSTTSKHFNEITKNDAKIFAKKYRNIE